MSTHISPSTTVSHSPRTKALPSSLCLYLHLLVEEEPLVHRRQRRRSGLVVGELHEGVRVVAGLPDDLAALDGPDLGEQRAQKVLRDRGVQVAYIQSLWMALVRHADAGTAQTGFHYTALTRARRIYSGADSLRGRDHHPGISRSKRRRTG